MRRASPAGKAQDTRRPQAGVARAKPVQPAENQTSRMFPSAAAPPVPARVPNAPSGISLASRRCLVRDALKVVALQEIVQVAVPKEVAPLGILKAAALVVALKEAVQVVALKAAALVVALKEAVQVVALKAAALVVALKAAVQVVVLKAAAPLVANSAVKKPPAGAAPPDRAQRQAGHQPANTTAGNQAKERVRPDHDQVHALHTASLPNEGNPPQPGMTPCA